VAGPPAPALLEVAGLSKRFGAIVVADEVTFSLASGECLGMIGPNGAGKSSIFNLIAGTLSADRGSVRLDGEEVIGLAAHLRARRGIVRAFQIPQPFPHLTVYENVLAAASFGGGLAGTEAGASALGVLSAMRLTPKADTLAGQLPLLDRKRLELGKAVASRARLLLLDEIAAGLTEPEVEDLVALISSLKRDHAIIWIEHIPHALRAVADRIMVLHFGRNVLVGPPADVMQSALVREIYMGFRADDAP
jgi:branched-chain amino acid transport system ATP-binding protein